MAAVATKNGPLAAVSCEAADRHSIQPSTESGSPRLDSDKTNYGLWWSDLATLRLVWFGVALAGGLGARGGHMVVLDRLILLALVVSSMVSTASADVEVTNDFWLRLQSTCPGVTGHAEQLEKADANVDAHAVFQYCVSEGTGSRHVPLFALDLDNREGVLTDLISTYGAAQGVPGTVAAGVVGDSLTDVMLRGLATVLVKRAKAELQQLVTNSIRDQVCTDKLKPWITHTCELIGGESNLGMTIGPALRAAIIQDITELPRRAITALDAAGPVEAYVSRLFLEAILEVPKHYSLRGLAIAWGRVAWQCDKAEKICVDAVKTVGLVVTLMRIVEDVTQDGFSVPSLASALSKRAAALGLNLDVATASRLVELQRIAVTTLKQFKASDAKKRREQTGLLMHALLDVADETITAVGDEVTAQKFRFIGDAADLLQFAADGDVSAVISQLLPHLKKAALPGDVVRVLTLGAELSAAKTSEEVEAAIEAVAAPLGSYRRKQATFTFSIGALVGAQWSSEAVAGDDGVPTGTSLGPTGLVGFDAAGPLNTPYLTAGLFVSLLDLGTILATQDEAKDMTNTTKGASTRLEQVFAPGIHVRVGSKALGPLVLFSGITWVPNYRELNDSPVNVRRFSLGLAVDVPLWLF
ncbi:MAG: hypothetical protein JWP01_578 [Myxococcales bacterium]|nr:hypothetical protein [Myxococcales bacterium]